MNRSAPVSIAGKPASRSARVATVLIWIASVLACAVIAIGRPTPALADTKFIRIIASAATSTPPDIISRIVAAGLARNEGWRVIVEDRPGAGGIVAGNDVLRRPADGSTILAIFLPNAAAHAIMKVPYRLDGDFEPLIKVSVSYNVLVVNPTVEAHSVPELVALLKRKPDTMTFSSGGYGTPAHLIGEMFKLKIGARATHVPYQQFPQAIGDLLAGVISTCSLRCSPSSTLSRLASSAPWP